MSDEIKKDTVIAFLLLNTRSDSTEEFHSELQKKQEVLESYIIYGDWDILIKVGFPSLPELTRFVKEIRKDEKINNTKTLITLQ